MNLLAGTLYDPAIAVAKVTTSLLAMTALDTTNLRLTFTVPPHGKVKVCITAVHYVDNSQLFPHLLLGVLEGAVVKGRVHATRPIMTSSAVADISSLNAEFLVVGLTPGAQVSLDAAYGVEIVSGTGGCIKYGGPNDTTENNAWGGFSFEIYDPQPIPVSGEGVAQFAEALEAWSENTVRSDN